MPFDLQIRFQQVSDPVPTEFSLNTQFHLLRKKSLWLSDGSMGFGEGIDTSFTAGMCWLYYLVFIYYLLMVETGPQRCGNDLKLLENSHDVGFPNLVPDLVAKPFRQRDSDLTYSDVQQMYVGHL